MRVILKVSPSHPLAEVGVIVYSTIALIVVELVMVPVTFPTPCALRETPETVPVMAVTYQAKVLSIELPPIALILSCGLKLKF